jgi:hypothetical protein
MGLFNFLNQKTDDTFTIQMRNNSKSDHRHIFLQALFLPAVH